MRARASTNVRSDHLKSPVCDLRWWVLRFKIVTCMIKEFGVYGFPDVFDVSGDLVSQITRSTNAQNHGLKY